MQIELGTRKITSVNDIDKRIALLLWGPAGCGKTTLAATAPGVKLWLLFDPDGALSLQGREDCMVLDLSGETQQITQQFKSDDPMGIGKMLTEHPEILTVVFDSATAYKELCTENAVVQTKSATLENPGLKGYGHRNALLLRALTSLMRLTKKLQRHFIIITHEDTPDKNEDGTINFITMALGGKMSNQIGLQLSEIWHMTDTGKEHKIALRPVRWHKPMKTRMFDATTTPEFTWRYNPNNWSGDGIETWFKAWEAKGGKIAVPK